MLEVEGISKYAGKLLKHGVGGRPVCPGDCCADFFVQIVVVNSLDVVSRKGAADVLVRRAELAAVILIFCAFGVGEEDKGQMGVIDGDVV